MSITVYLIILVLGLALGSFINAFVWRLHQQSKESSKGNKNQYSILTGRSMCPRCHHKLEPLDLIPIASWLLLRAKCRYCHRPIAAIYPLVELITATLFLASYGFWPLIFNSRGIFYFVIWLILLTGLIALAVYDIRWLKLPNRIVYPLVVLVIIQILTTLIFFNGTGRYILNDLLGLAIGGGVFYILFQISGGKWIGGGDVRLGALLGLYLGSASYAVLMIFFASLIGSLYSLPLLATGKMNRKALIPYGPFLIAVTIILRLFGKSLTSWLKL